MNMRHAISLMESLHRLDEQVDITSPSFRQWFGRSKVVAPDGTPLVCFHGTGTNTGYNRQPFHPGAFDHFGTIGAANQRLADLMDIDRQNGAGQDSSPAHRTIHTPQVFTVYLSIQQPLFFEDIGENWFSDDAFEMMVRLNGFSQRAVAAAKARDQDWDQVARAAGYDGVRYINNHEDPGHTSWCPFADRQVWNVLADHPGHA